MTLRVAAKTQYRGGVRPLFRTGELTERNTNDVLLDICLRIEALERAVRVVDKEFVELTFTTGASGYTASSQTFVRNSEPVGIDVIRVINNTSGSEVLYETVSAQDYSYLNGIITLRHVTGLLESSSYTLTLVVY